MTSTTTIDNNHGYSGETKKPPRVLNFHKCFIILLVKGMFSHHFCQEEPTFGFRRYLGRTILTSVERTSFIDEEAIFDNLS